MGKLLATIDEFPGTLKYSAYCLGVDAKYFDDAAKNAGIDEFSKDNAEYQKVRKAYVEEGMALADIPDSLNVSRIAASGWCGDILHGVVRRAYEIAKAMTAARKNIAMLTSGGSNEGFDIYEYAKTTDADYMDMKSYNIYKVQEYNQKQRFGIPTLGIRVVDSMTGETVGYAQQATM